MKELNEIVLILGRRGEGKTTLSKLLIKKRSRVVVWDTLGEYQATVVGFDSLSSLHSYIVEKERFKVSYIPGVGGGTTEEFDNFCKYIWALSEYRELTLVVEEVDQVSSPGYVPPYFNTILRLGRHRGLRLICISRRASEVPKLLTSQTTHFISFSQKENRDIDYLRRYWSSDIVLKLKILPKFSYLELYQNEVIVKKLPKFKKKT